MVLYHDTDSIIYTYLLHQLHPEMGTYLGELTDELTCKNVGCEGCLERHWIVEFISCRAKNYGYRLNSGQVMCKVRGFSLNYRASQTLNLNSMRGALQCWMKGDEAPELVTTKTLILRNKLKGYVYTYIFSKHYRVVYNKRRILENFDTCPYGYVDV